MALVFNVFIVLLQRVLNQSFLQPADLTVPQMAIDEGILSFKSVGDFCALNLTVVLRSCFHFHEFKMMKLEL